MTTIFFHEDWPLKLRNIYYPFSLFVLGLLGCEQSPFYFLSHLDRAASVRVANLLCSRSIGLFVVLQRTHTFFSHSPAKHSTTRFVQLLYVPHKRESRSSFLQDFFRCIIVTALPREKASKEQTKYQIRYMKKEKDKEKK